MPGFNSTMYISNDFRELIQRGNKYEDYVLEIMNLSRSIFPNRYYKINEQSNNEPDFKECGSDKPFDAKLVFSTAQGKKLCGENDAAAFFEEMVKQNNSMHDSIINETSDISELTSLLKKHLEKQTTQGKNIIFFFTFPIEAPVTGSIAFYFIQDMLAQSLSSLSPFTNGREVYGICPTLDDHYEIRKMGSPDPEFVHYTELDKYFKWSIGK